MNILIQNEKSQLTTKFYKLTNTIYITIEKKNNTVYYFYELTV